MVKPGGTGNPIDAISAKLAPFPPSSSRIEALPSVFRPKANTYFFEATVFLGLEAFFAREVLICENRSLK